MARQKNVIEIVQANYPEFHEECDELTAEDIDARLAKNAKDAEAVEVAQEADEKYQEAKQTASDLGAPYRDAKKELKLKARYLIALIKDRGGK